MPDDDGSDDGEESSPGGWRALEERYNAEPEEFDPQELGPDIPEAPDLTEVEASSEVQYRFWALVMVFNVALLATSIGVMFIGFQGEWTLGGQLTIAGLVLFAFGYYRYRQTKAALAEKDEDGDDISANEDGDHASDGESRDGASGDGNGDGHGHGNVDGHGHEDGDGHGHDDSP